MADLSLHRGARPIQLDRERFLLYNLAATWLLYQRYGSNFLGELYDVMPGTDGRELKLKSPEALVFFLWAGLQADAKNAGEELTLEQVEPMISPFAFARIFNRIVQALSAAMESPQTPGKAGAEGKPAAPAAQNGPGPAKSSTPMKRSGLRLQASAGRPKSSGKRRSANTTSRGKASSRK